MAIKNHIFCEDCEQDMTLTISDDQIIDIVSVISMFGFLNRWNDTLGTRLEDVPKSFVEEKLKPLGWS